MPFLVTVINKPISQTYITDNVTGQVHIQAEPEQHQSLQIPIIGRTYPLYEGTGCFSFRMKLVLVVLQSDVESRLPSVSVYHQKSEIRTDIVITVNSEI